jgi:hypothetical protein
MFIVKTNVIITAQALLMTVKKVIIIKRETENQATIQRIF